MPTITVNAEPRTFPDPLTVADLLRHLGKDPRKLAVEVNRDRRAPGRPPGRAARRRRRGRDRHARRRRATRRPDGPGPTARPRTRPLRGRQVHLHLAGCSPAPGSTPPYDLMRQCMEASGCEVTTVAVRRERLIDKDGKSLLDFLDLKKLTILPNTAGCFSAEDAVRHARLARELLTNLENPGADWVKLECLADKKTLLPDPIDTLKATEQLVKEGFTVLVYTSRRPGAGEAAEGSRGGERDAGRQPDRQRPGHPEPEQHPHLPGVPEGRRPGLPGDRGRRAWAPPATWPWRWNSAATGCC